MNRKPITTGAAIDFAGEVYEVEALPDVAGCNEGDRCEVCWPGGSGWYQTGYIVRDGRWVEEWSTAPWQLSVG